MDQLIQLLSSGAVIAFLIVMAIGYFCWPALLVYAVISQSRSLRRIAIALEGPREVPAVGEFFAASRPAPIRRDQSGSIVPSAFGR